MSVYSGALSRRSVHPAAPVLLTKNGPLDTRILLLSFGRASLASYPFKV
jgi:hypothetical protein